MLFSIDYQFGTTNRWEINNGIHGIMRIDELIAACDPYEEPAALTVKGLDGIDAWQK